MGVKRIVRDGSPFTLLITNTILGGHVYGDFDDMNALPSSQLAA